MFEMEYLSKTMPYVMISCNIREGQLEAYRKFLRSVEFSAICKNIKKQSDFKFIETYFRIIPSAYGEGDFDAYIIWEFPNMAAWDKARESNAFAELLERSYNMIEPRPTKFTLLRTARDVKIIYEPKPDK